MAGDWIKMRHDLCDDPAVISLAENTACVDESHVIGVLHKLWSWADRQTTDGYAPSVTVSWREWLDRYLGVTGFADALIKVGWLEIKGDSFAIPKFDAHNSKSAKNRALSSQRMLRKRYADGVTKTPPEESRVEKSRKEKRKKEDSSEPAEAANSKPAVMVFPIVGKGPKTWELTPEHLAEFEHAFPALAVLAEFGRANLWLSNNPGRKKTAGGMARFLGSWLGRAQNAGQGEGVTPPKGSLCAGLNLEKKIR